ncbi:methylated-DNA--protein-cysteine methyltransferase [Streptomyces spiroverticillatus]|uniref:Methylated-DNA--protein-cysteine methyltransferase n=1 Tax=Streptomyces finlayi TaxID=67296 RepID=A0A918WT82_9ACTN|nr:methylated-DNA--[protein]-cysteine S-methyltransferase [Streptomyces finlayi]GGZ89184.1 methylated-DNA--protein-cysteine methyltransferase [Streptomyces spiroverticillatus]GHC80083.1 methylated-DNA--protein-cysteine methyltransferase [Streptomyces finlayi]
MSGTTVYATLDSPLGELLLVGEESASAPDGVALLSLSVPDQKGGAVVGDGWRRAPELFGEVAAQLKAYFAGELTRFDIAYADGVGTEFQRRVWSAVENIAYGETTSYGKLAESIGVSRAAVRAVGTAIGRNPLLVVRPCHRIVGADGSLTGYAGGLERKRLLLELEGGQVR